MLSQQIIRGIGTLALAACLPIMAKAQSTGVAWRTNLDAAKMEASQSRRLLLLHFTQRTCGPCKLLDQNVFNQPQVGAAVEQHYVPVRIDADASPALAASFRIESVPTEIVLTPEGNELARPPIPKNPEPYIAQLQNLARHFSQSAGMTPGAPQPGVNPAYANLPIAPAPSVNPQIQPQAQPQTPPPAAAAPVPPLAVTTQPAPQTQANPFINAAANPDRYGEAKSVYPAPAQQPDQAPALSNAQAQGAQPPANPTSSATIDNTPAMPSNAMPRSYKQGDATAAVAAAVPSIAATTAPLGAAPGIGTGQIEAGASAATQIATTGAAAAAVAAAVPKSTKPEQPAGAPPLAFDGCCPVTLKTINKWAYGDAQFGAVHRGRTYLFAGATERDQFMANPDAYSPVFAGLDPVLLMDKQQAVEGNRANGYRYGDAFYLFSSKETMQKFKENHQAYAAGVRQAMNRIDATNGGTVLR